MVQRLTTQETGAVEENMNDSSLTLILTSSLFDAHTLAFVKKKNILVNRMSGLIQSVTTRSASEDLLSARTLATQAHADTVIDLRDPSVTVLPGLVDAHTHLFLHPYSEASNDHQRVNEGLLERTIRATVHARNTLDSGFTTVRDLGTESALDADIALRNSIEAGVIPGPRIMAATQAIVPSGTYEPPNPNYQGGTRVPPGGDVGDGADGVRAAVRRRLGAGADVIKIYADYPRLRNQRNPPNARHKPLPSAPSIQDLPCFTPAELSAIVDEASLARTPVAAHVKTATQIAACLRAGVHSIEHGYGADAACFELMKERRAVWVPTLAAVRSIYGADDARYAAIRETFMLGVQAGVTIAAGGDTGVFAHGENALEMECMIEAGMGVEAALRAATLGGFEASGGEEMAERLFGALREGWCGDVVAVRGEMTKKGFARGVMRDVVLVVKSGVVVVNKL